MPDCISCDKLVACDEDKVVRMMKVGECADYAELRVRSRKAPRICKYCGEEYNGVETRSVCERCLHKAPLLPQFKKSRDYIREKCGLERLGDA